MEKQELIQELENYYYSHYQKGADNDELKIKLMYDLKDYILENICIDGDRGIYYLSYFFKHDMLKKILNWVKETTGTDYRDLCKIKESIQNFGWVYIINPMMDIISEFSNEVINLLFKEESARILPSSIGGR